MANEILLVESKYQKKILGYNLCYKESLLAKEKVCAEAMAMLYPK